MVFIINEYGSGTLATKDIEIYHVFCPFCLSLQNIKEKLLWTIMIIMYFRA